MSMFSSAQQPDVPHTRRPYRGSCTISFTAFPALIFLLWVAPFTGLKAQSLPSGTTARIDSIFAEYTQPGSPGCAMAIYRDGAIIYSKGYGTADLEHNVSIGPDTRFDIGSTSKQFTATCILLLAQEGKLSLDDDVRKYIPELPNYGQTITIRNMLTHTSGLRDYIGLMVMSGMNIDDVTTTQDALQTVVRQEGMEFDPGTKFRYSNTGYFLASVLVQRVSGQSIREFAKEHIFAPLGMKSSGYIDDHTAIVPNRAIAYSPDGDGEYHRDVSYWEQNGDGGVFTTVEDLLFWDENFYHPNVGGASLPQNLMRRGVLKNGDTLDYGLGLFLDDIRGVPMVSHGGAWGGYRAELMRIPSEHVSVAVLANMGEINPELLASQVLEIVLEGRLPKAPVVEETPVKQMTADQAVKIDPTLFDAYVGDFALDVQPTFVLTFRHDGDHYYSQATGQAEVEIYPSSDSTFFLTVDPAILTFHRGTDGNVSQMTLHDGGDYTAQRVKRQMLSPQKLNEYAGVYFSPELGVRYTLANDNGTLVAKSDRFDPINLTPSRDDFFGGDQWNLEKVRFERDKNGRVEKMLVTAGRVRDLRFVKEE